MTWRDQQVTGSVGVNDGSEDSNQCFSNLRVNFSIRQSLSIDYYNSK